MKSDNVMKKSVRVYPKNQWQKDLEAHREKILGITKSGRIVYEYDPNDRESQARPRDREATPTDAG